MIEIDELMVESARQHLPLLNDCSPFSSGSCFDEPRTDLLLEDAFAWFMTRFKLGEPSSEEKFDLIIFDALDPEDPVEFAEALYQSTAFWGSILEALLDDGILVMQVGSSPAENQYGEQFGLNKNRAALFKTVKKIGFESMHIFEERHCGFVRPWSFLVACKSAERCSWFHNSAEVEFKIRQRILPRHDGENTLRYFDGATMHSYQTPTRAWQTVYCRAEPQPPECALLGQNAPQFRVELESLRQNGRQFIAESDIPVGSHLRQETFQLTESASSIISQLGTKAFSNLPEAAEPKNGSPLTLASLKLLGCTVDPLLLDTSKEVNLSQGVSPVRDRNRWILDTGLNIARETIQEGQVIVSCV
uniref:PABS domain-containing protein n=1 Tax=Cyclophora tenuis TaxID=216820 RepID=A0A6U1Q2V6_CYCTE|mmetsp:Transcript_16889/g.28696  ORF Transcript_16889/g.28696 Transcript_16889/m.28696 type:complete len:361 (+) Transcript_16889:3-1085(+)